MIVKDFLRILYHSTPFTWRVPSVYYNTLREIDGNMNREEIRKWQLVRLKSIVRHAYNDVPGYYALYKEAGVKPEDINDLKDIKLLPLVDKVILRDNIKDFTARNVNPKSIYLTRTSGTSGTPFGFYKTIDEEWSENAFVGRAWAIGGWDIHQSGIMLRGAYAGDSEHIYKKCDNNNFYVHNNSYLLSPNFLTEDYYAIYRDFLVKHSELSYFFALPSSITLLAQLMIAHHDEGISNASAIYLGSESVYDWQYDYIQKAFPMAKIISLYGQTERVIMAYWCDDNQQYHIDPFYGLTEILNNNMEVREGERGELVGTSFWNTTTPFIRYRTRDFAVKGGAICEKCGLPYQLLERIDGRLQDVLIGKDGRYIPYTAFDGSLLHGSVFKSIIQYKIIQKERGRLLFQIKVVDGFSEDKKTEFEQIITSYLGADFEAQIEIVDSIASGNNGKFSIVEQHLPISIESRIRNKFNE